MKLWQSGYDLDDEAERFTVGEDYLFDRRLIQADCIGTAAHARMLASIGLLTDDEALKLTEALVSAMERARDGSFTVERADEDVHTAVEGFLVRELGELGKKVHAGRSRNDQVALDLKLYAKEALPGLALDCLTLVRALLRFAESHRLLPMVGRTHMQKAMVSSVGLWAGAFAESVFDDVGFLSSAYDYNDQSPLGSAASYGVPVPLDRDLIAQFLSFSRVQNNVLYANNARGTTESVVAFACAQVMLDLSRLVQDVMLWSMPEFGYFVLPKELCPGSSIMPQKKNPGVLELARAKAAGTVADLHAILETVRALPSGYNRDLQETKGRFFRVLDVTRSTARIIELTVEKLQVDEEKVLSGFSPEVFAADRALELVGEGTPFREAYRRVKEGLNELAARDPKEELLKRTHRGTAADLRLEELRQAVEKGEHLWRERLQGFHNAVTELLGVNYPPGGPGDERRP